MTRSYIASRAAAADLRQVTSYSIERWGKEKCRTYIAGLEQCTEALAMGNGFYKDMSALYPDLWKLIIPGKFTAKTA